MKPIITLTTDFGYKDNFVGVMKGVMLKINPDAVLVDLTHDIPLFDPEAAGFCLQTAHRFFPENTVHLAVVDPGGWFGPIHSYGPGLGSIFHRP